MRGFPLALAVVAAVALSGCEETKKALGQGKQAPDEFAVFQRAPLSLPPDFALRPPAPGSERPQGVTPREQARIALGQQPASASVGNMSAGEQAVLQLTGAGQVTPGIRGIVNSETRALEIDSQSFRDKIVFWQNKPEFGTALDPVREVRRLRENQATGKALNSGEVPIIQRREKALFER